MPPPEPSKAGDLPAALTAPFSPGQVRHGRADDAVDGLLPPVVITPRNVEEVLSVVRTASAENLAVLPAGGGSMIDLGNPPSSLDVRLAVKGLSQILDRCPQDMTVTVEAGVGLNRLNRVLEPDGQRVAIDPPDDDLATVGGLVSTNRTGGYAYGFGLPRDLVLGLRLVDGRARVLRAGGKVVKNVAGYDLVRLATGSHGTLGVITEVTLRTHPIPDDFLSLRFTFESRADLESARARVYASGLPLAAFDFAADRMPADHGWSLLVRAEGTRESVAYQAEHLTKLCGRGPVETAKEWESSIHAEAEEDTVLRYAAQPAALLAVTETILASTAKLTTRARAAGRLGDGLGRVFLRMPDPAAAATAVRTVRSAVADASVRVVAERLPCRAKSSIDVWGQAPAGFEIMRGLKQVFDPLSLFSPGRFVGGV